VITERLVGSVLVVTLDRPEVLNALDDRTLDALLETWGRVSSADVGAVVLTGAGRAFCAGADMNGPVRDAQELAENQRTRYNANALTLSESTWPVIAAVNGLAVGAGLALAAMCDIRIASETAFFRTGFASLGAVPDAGASWSIPRLIGVGRAA
jgi:2-(1,2-epoxy-1,2-dihydrophenyl)acetyl-CoA isomerase